MHIKYIFIEKLAPKYLYSYIYMIYFILFGLTLFSITTYIQFTKNILSTPLKVINDDYLYNIICQHYVII